MVSGPDRRLRGIVIASARRDRALARLCEGSTVRRRGGGERSASAVHDASSLWIDRVRVIRACQHASTQLSRPPLFPIGGRFRGHSLPYRACQCSLSSRPGVSPEASSRYRLSFRASLAADASVRQRCRRHGVAEESVLPYWVRRPDTTTDTPPLPTSHGAGVARCRQSAQYEAPLGSPSGQGSGSRACSASWR